MTFWTMYCKLHFKIKVEEDKGISETTESASASGAVSELAENVVSNTLRQAVKAWINYSKLVVGKPAGSGTNLLTDCT